ncbi:MAG: alpha-mannosidase [Clostridia bacterium]|nr:alpha-mannosidase [Clostridia bacterium]
MTFYEKLKRLNTYRSLGKNAERICSQLTYLSKVSSNHEGKYNDRIEEAVDYLLSQIDRENTVTLSDVLYAENMLADLSHVAKSYTELFVAHAHIDLNWKWGFHEAASVTVDTFRTILDLMREYPTMTYTQSQAVCFKIVEELCPELIPEIKERIKEGRWEITAAEWIEPDKNMPDGESLSRHILQGKRYMAELFDIDPKELNINFLPDTFGFNANVPEILVNAGMKYMYHTRAHEGPCLYYYVAPSGKRTMNYREYILCDVKPDKFERVADFCAAEKVDTYLYIYGVGDHGGGPSRRDIETVLEYQSWPLTPNIKFGTFREFFSSMERYAHQFPEIKEERNFIFTGCYTSHGRIKMANRIAEARMNEAEALSAAASLLADAPRNPRYLDDPWQNLLYNHFHDILPGSGTIETTEYAMGLFQRILYKVNPYGSLSMRRMAEAVDTSLIPFESTEGTVSEGAGTGFYQGEDQGFRFPAAERGRGPVRAFHLFNTTGFAREEYTEITVWDYTHDMDNIVLTDADGNELPFYVAETGTEFWDHYYTKIMACVTIPACSYKTVVLKQRVIHTMADYGRSANEGMADHVNWPSIAVDDYLTEEPIVLENDVIKAVFERKTMRLIALMDKRTDETLIDEPSCYFRFVNENSLYWGAAWRVGTAMREEDLNASCDVRYYDYVTSPHFTRVRYEIAFGASHLNCTVELKKGSPVLEFTTTVDWNERAVPNKKIPQLRFVVPLGYKTKNKCLCDIPYGDLERKALAHDVPCLSYMAVEGETESALSLITDTKYGYRLWEDVASVNLIRSAYDPDPYQDQGPHRFRIGLAVGAVSEARRRSAAFNHPIAVTPATKHKGSLPLDGSFLRVDGDVIISCIKNSEDGRGTTVRLFDVIGKDSIVTLRFAKAVKTAFLTNTNELDPIELPVTDGAVTVTVPEKAVVTVVSYFN